MELSDTEKLIMSGKICPYCLNKSEYVDSSIIYGRSYGMIYLCKSCDAYCGVHKGTDNALGRLANKELRYWKKEAHKYFDALWRLSDRKSERGFQYSQLSKYLGIPIEYTHIGMFGVETCKMVVEWAKNKNNSIMPFTDNEVDKITNKSKYQIENEENN